MDSKQNYELLKEFHLGMFEYTGLPDTLPAKYFESFLIDENKGMCAFFRIPEGHESPGFPVGSLIAASCTLGTDLTPYGRGSEVIAVTRNGWEYRADRFSDDIVVGFNNLSETYCTDIKADADTLSDIDTSLDFLIFWTRLAPLVRVGDEKERAQVITAFKNMQKGIPVTLVTKKLLSDLGLSDSFGVEDLTRPEVADKIQYTARLREDILRWHYTRYGQVVQGDTKLAQQSVDEVNGTVSSSLIIPLNMLAARREFVSEINRKFGTNITVDFSGPWRGEITKYENDTGEGSVDGSPDDQEKEDLNNGSMDSPQNDTKENN